MALTSLAYSQHEIAVTNWQPETVDEILDIGNSQFLDALQRGFIPDAPTLSVEQLPTTVYFATSNEVNNDLPFVAQNEISKPTVVLPHVAMKTKSSETPIEAPKSETPIEAPNNSDFPIVERKSESPIVVVKSEMPIVATKAIPEKPSTETNSKFNILISQEAQLLLEMFLKALSLLIHKMKMIHHSFLCIQHLKMFLQITTMQFSY